MPGDQARLLVADALLPQRLPEQRKAQQPALQRHPLQDRAARHSQPLLAVMAEVDEPEWLPRTAAVEDRGHESEDVVPAVAHLHQSLQLGIDAPGIGLPAELHGFERVDLHQVCPEPGLALEDFFERLDLAVAPLLEPDIVRRVVDATFWGCRMRAVVLLPPDLHALRLRRSVAQHDASPA